MTEQQSRFRQLAGVLKALQDQVGHSAAALLGADAETIAMEAMTTGHDDIDGLFGGDGLPRQRICEVFGPPACGKTALAMSIIARVQRGGGVAAYLDIEHGFDAARATALGVDTSLLVLSRPATAEEALFVAEELVRSGAVDLVVLDSVAALVPEAELDGRVGEAPIGLQARLVGQALRRLTVALRRSTASVLLVNHLRPGPDGQPGSTPGGSALPFFAAVRLQLERLSANPRTDPGNLRVRASVVKSKLGPSGGTAVLDLVGPTDAADVERAAA